MVKGLPQYGCFRHSSLIPSTYIHVVGLRSTEENQYIAPPFRPFTDLSRRSTLAEGRAIPKVYVKEVLFPLAVDGHSSTSGSQVLGITEHCTQCRVPLRILCEGGDRHQLGPLTSWKVQAFQLNGLGQLSI